MISDLRAASPRQRQAVGIVVGSVGLAMLFPFLVPRSMVGAANIGAAYALVALSLVVLTGWVGQISLGHAALVGVGGYATGWIAGGAGIPFPLSVPLAAAGAAALAAVLGLVALRVRGLYLAVATLVFNWMASEFLFRQEWFVRHNQIPDRAIGGGQGWLPRFDFTDRRTFYLVAWAIVAAVVLGLANLRDSKTGRAFYAVRGSEMAAASLGIDVMRTKLVAFACSGAVAGAAGNLLMSDARVITADQFGFNVSLFYLAMAVVGGLGSLGGALASALVFAGMTEVFFRVPALGGFLELVSGLLLAIVLLSYKGGLASLGPRLPAVFRSAARTLSSLRAPTRQSPSKPRGPAALMRRAAGGLARRMQPIGALAPLASALGSFAARPSRSLAPTQRRRLDLDRVLFGEQTTAEPTGTEPADAAVTEASANGHAGPAAVAAIRARLAPAPAPTGPRTSRIAAIDASGITVRFGGLTAVNDASLSVREGEIVGLIGPNGAGKTTLFNAIAGFNSPAAGTIRIFDTDVTALPVHLRARVGIARTFQAIQLFSALSVFDNLLVATHVEVETGLWSHVVASERAIAADQTARERVGAVLELLGLAEFSDRLVADLPFGVLRMVEVARALVTGFPLMMLDEPASGLDNNETDKLMEVLGFVRSLGVTQLLIEHDVRMVTGVSDYMYVLDQGRIIAEGNPADIQRNPAVIAAYLGEPATEAVG